MDSETREILERNNYRVVVRELEVDLIELVFPYKTSVKTVIFQIFRKEPGYQISIESKTPDKIPCPEYAIRSCIMVLINKTCSLINYDPDYIFYYDICGNEQESLPIFPPKDKEKEQQLINLWNTMCAKGENTDEDAIYFLQEAESQGILEGFIYLNKLHEGD